MGGLGLRRLVLRKAADAERWVTIGGHAGERGAHEGGQRVLIDGDGRIVGGSVPKFFHGMSVREMGNDRMVQRRWKETRREITDASRQLQKMEDSIPSLARQLKRDEGAARRYWIDRIREVTDGQMITPDKTEENREIPSYFKRNAKDGVRRLGAQGSWHVDAVADALGMTENQLRATLADAHRSARDGRSIEYYTREAEHMVRSDDQYLAMERYLESLKDAVGSYRGPKKVSDAAARTRKWRERQAQGRPQLVIAKGYLTDTYGDDPEFRGFGETTRPHQRSRDADDEVAVNENVFAKGGRPHHHGADKRVYRCRHGDGGRMVLQDGDRHPTWISDGSKRRNVRLLLRAMETPYWEKAYRDGPDILAPTPNTAHVAAHGVNTEGATVRIDKNGRIYIRGRNAEAVKSRLRARLDTMQTSEAWVGGHMTLGQDKGFQRYPEARKSMPAEEKARPSYRRRLAREKRIRAWKKREPLTAAERAEARARFGRTLASGVGWAKFAGGYVCYTHRARSNVYPSIAKMPASVVKFIESTG